MTTTTIFRALRVALVASSLVASSRGLGAQNSIAVARHAFASSIPQVLSIRQAGSPVFVGASGTSTIQAGGNVAHQVRVRLTSAPVGAVVMVRDVTGTLVRVQADAEVVVAAGDPGMRTSQLSWRAEGLRGGLVEVSYSIVPSSALVADARTITAR